MKKITTFILALAFMSSTSFALNSKTDPNPVDCYELADAFAFLAAWEDGASYEEQYDTFVFFYDDCMAGRFK